MCVCVESVVEKLARYGEIVGTGRCCHTEAHVSSKPNLKLDHSMPHLRLHKLHTPPYPFPLFLATRNLQWVRRGVSVHLRTPLGRDFMCWGRVKILPNSFLAWG